MLEIGVHFPLNVLQDMCCETSDEISSLISVNSIGLEDIAKRMNTEVDDVVANLCKSDFYSGYRGYRKYGGGN